MYVIQDRFSAHGKLMHVLEILLKRNSVNSVQLGHKVLLKAHETGSLEDG